MATTAAAREEKRIGLFQSVGAIALNLILHTPDPASTPDPKKNKNSASTSLRAEQQSKASTLCPLA
jgi:hypothetical protein